MGYYYHFPDLYDVNTAYNYLAYTNIQIACMVGSIILSLLGAFLLYKKILRVAVGLSGFCFFGTFVWSLGFAIEKHGANSVSIAAMVFACAGAISAFIPDPLSFIVLGMGCGTTIHSFVNWYFECGYINSFVCLLTSAVFGFILFKFPSFQTFAINWIGSYFAVSGLMMLLFIVLVFNNVFEFYSTIIKGIYAISSLAIIGIIVTFGITSRHLFTNNPSNAGKA